jgi:hypothetical protein
MLNAFSAFKKMIKTQMPEREGRGSGRRRKGWSRRRVEAEFCSLQACIPHLAASTHSRLHILLEAINYIGRVFNGFVGLWFSIGSYVSSLILLRIYGGVSG